MNPNNTSNDDQIKMGPLPFGDDKKDMTQTESVLPMVTPVTVDSSTSSPIPTGDFSKPKNKMNSKIIIGALAIVGLLIAGGVVAMQSSGGFLAQNQDTRSRAACISCGGGTCPDGWSYGADSCAPQSSCGQRATDACSGHQGGGSNPTSAPTSSGGGSDDCTGKNCGYGSCFTGPNAHDGGWGCNCQNGTVKGPSTNPGTCPAPATGTVAPTATVAPTGGTGGGTKSCNTGSHPACIGAKDGDTTTYQGVTGKCGFNGYINNQTVCGWVPTGSACIADGGTKGNSYCCSGKSYTNASGTVICGVVGQTCISSGLKGNGTCCSGVSQTTYNGLVYCGTPPGTTTAQCPSGWICGTKCASSADVTLFNNTWCDGRNRWLYESGCGGNTSKLKTAAGGCTGTPTGTTTVAPTGGTGGTGSCGALNQACCDPFSNNGLICSGNLYCNAGKCLTSPGTNICSGGQGEGGTPSGQCAVFTCGNRCDKTQECTLNRTVVPCASASLNGQCGQIDYLNGSGGYCGVKSQNCGGSCAGGAPTTTVTTTTTTKPTTTTTTSVVAGQCTAVKLWVKDATGAWVNITFAQAGAKIKVGDTVRLSTIGSGRVFTSGRFRIKVGAADYGAWLTTSTKDKGEYYINYVIPSAGNFGVQAQVL